LHPWRGMHFIATLSVIEWEGRKLLSVQTRGMPKPLSFSSMPNTLGLFPRFITLDCLQIKVRPRLEIRMLSKFLTMQTLSKLHGRDGKMKQQMYLLSLAIWQTTTKQMLRVWCVVATNTFEQLVYFAEIWTRVSEKFTHSTKCTRGTRCQRTYYVVPPIVLPRQCIYAILVVSRSIATTMHHLLYIYIYIYAYMSRAAYHYLRVHAF
jgi:hypothetical protein